MTALPVLTDTLDNYLVEIERFPLLTKQEEHSLAIRYFERGDRDAAHSLVTANLRFVVKTALEFRSYGLNIKDLIQEGNIGLMTAVKKFNPYKGFRLITYAVWWIKSCIQEYILKSKGLVKRNSRALKKKLFYRSDVADTSVNTDNNMLSTNDLSLDAPVAADGTVTHLERLTDPSLSHEEELANTQEHAIVKKDVSTALALLSDRERFILENRVMTDSPQSLQFVGDKLGLTRERVRQIQCAALKKLKGTLPSSYTLANSPLQS